MLRPGTDAPVWIPLCEESDLQDLLGKADGRRADIQARITYDTFGDALYDLVWQPLEQELAGVKTIYYSPSGLLHKISFNALPSADEAWERLSDQYDLNLVSSTREVVHFARNQGETPRQISSAVLYGGLEYNTDSAVMRMMAQLYTRSSETLVASAPPAGITRGGAWDFLPNSREEALSIQGYLDEKEINNTLYQDNFGSEESFKQLNGAHTGLLHIATHGFFLPDAERRHEERENIGGSRGGAMKAIENPLLRSGLVLAGGNHAWTEEPVEGVEDGILTAEEIAGLNLIGAELVVLSACQTGLGDVKNSEGVFGLQRAFKLAGVETLIMSLWEVDDAATAKLMNTFYEGWLLQGKSKQEAFKEARRAVREAYPEPFYWAAFVMMD